MVNATLAIRTVNLIREISQNSLMHVYLEVNPSAHNKGEMLDKSTEAYEDNHFFSRFHMHQEKNRLCSISKSNEVEKVTQSAGKNVAI